VAKIYQMHSYLGFFLQDDSSIIPHYYSNTRIAGFLYATPSLEA
jgi:hypothetical protein